jgi:GNAT superfamily N-acetyltransferase
MKIAITGVGSPALREYVQIPIAFQVTSILDVTRNHEEGTFQLSEHSVEPPYLKDYDALGEMPAGWGDRFDTSNWCLLVARIDGRCVGGATIAFNTPGLDMLEGRSDLAVLWDIRVARGLRRRGVGGALLEAGETWARGHGCRHLKVETQNVNVPACRFYARHGFVLQTVRSGMYPQCPDEVQLLWYKALDKRSTEE